MIPPIDHRYGAHWPQPDHTIWLMDATHVMLPESHWQALNIYDSTLPSGQYVGKVWRHGKMVAWYDTDPDPAYLAINNREAIVVPDDEFMR